MSTEITITGAKPADVLEHTLSYDGMDNSVRSYILSRTIRGVIWLDDNRNGIRDPEEQLYTHRVTVRLLKRRENTGGISPVISGAIAAGGRSFGSLLSNAAIGLFGGTGMHYVSALSSVDVSEYEQYEQYDSMTTENGEYRFEDMPAGTYAVEFSTPYGSVPLGSYVLTDSNVSDDAHDAIDSDAEPIYSDEHRGVYLIHGVEMIPTDQIRVPQYEKKELDAGLYRPNMTVSKSVTGEEKEGDEVFSFTLSIPDTASGDGPFDAVKTDAQGEQTQVSVTADQLKSGYGFTLSDGESITFPHLPANLEYTLSEDDYIEDGYGTSVDGERTNIVSSTLDRNLSREFVNDYRARKDVTVKIVWDDSSDHDGKRPDETTVHILADGSEVDHAPVSESDGWEHTFEHLTIYNDSGEEIVYTVTEDAVEDYTTEVNNDDYVITNTHDTPFTEVSGNIIWNDGDDQDKLRPKEVKVTLFEDGKKGSEQTVTAENDWKWDFGDLPKYDGTKEIDYSVKNSEDVPGYSAAYEKDKITLTHTPSEKDSDNPGDTGKTSNTGSGSGSGSSNTNNNSSGTGSSNTGSTSSNSGSYSVKTGDSSDSLVWIQISILLLLAAVVVLRRKGITGLRCFLRK